MMCRNKNGIKIHTSLMTFNFMNYNTLTCKIILFFWNFCFWKSWHQMNVIHKFYWLDFTKHVNQKSRQVFNVIIMVNRENNRRVQQSRIQLQCTHFQLQNIHISIFFGLRECQDRIIDVSHSYWCDTTFRYKKNPYCFCCLLYNFFF